MRGKGRYDFASSSAFFGHSEFWDFSVPSFSPTLDHIRGGSNTDWQE
jgi:hypothetical protein